jgi:hypothetical protein
MTAARVVAVLFATVALMACGCGSMRSTRSTTTRVATATRPTVTRRTPARAAAPQHPGIHAPNHAGTYRLVGLPIVVRAGNPNETPAIGLYFRVNHSLRLTDRSASDLLTETIDDVTTDNLDGTGVNSFAQPNCYFAYIDGVPGYYDLASARPGQIIHVTIAFHYPHARGVLSADVRLRAARPGEAGTEESPRRFRQLGCGNP